jgi:hypothetical protein
VNIATLWACRLRADSNMFLNQAPFVDLLHGSMWSEGCAWPLTLQALLCDLRPRFIPKRRIGRGYRAIARNGRVLIASDAPLAELAEKAAIIRMQTWHKAILPGDCPQPYGILLVIRRREDATASYATRLEASADVSCELAIDVGGGSRLEFHRVVG